MSMTDQAPELLPCPFCKVDSIGMEYSRDIFAGQAYASHSNSDGWKARCDGCGNQTAWWHTEHLARKAWNTRPTPSERPVAQVREALDALLELRNRDPAVYDIHHELSKIIALVRSLTSERPFEEAVAWTEEERHAIAHARHQVEQASPEKPDCCFDFDLVKDLLRVIDRAAEQSEASQ